MSSFVTDFQSWFSAQEAKPFPLFWLIFAHRHTTQLSSARITAWPHQQDRLFHWGVQHKWACGGPELSITYPKYLMA